MSEEHAKGVERRCSAVVNAIMQANNFDSVQCAFVASSAVLIIGDDQMARTALARLMMKLAHDLDGDIANATLQ